MVDTLKAVLADARPSGRAQIGLKSNGLSFRGTV